MKNNSIKTKAFIALSAVLLLSATKPKPSNGPGNPRVLADATTNRGIVARYSSFEVSVSSPGITPLTLYSYGYLRPNADYGSPCYLDFTLNNDNTIDAFWVTANENPDQINAFRSDQKHISRISLSTQSKLQDFIIPTEATVYDTRLLGFESLGNNKFIIGYSSAPEPGTINTIGDGTKTITRAYLTGFDGSTGQTTYTTEMFRNQNINYGSEGVRYLPGQTSTPTLRYNKAKDVVALYMGHRNESGHQGGFFTMINATTGAPLVNVSGNAYIGNIWNYSHVFDMRVLAPQHGNADFYTTSHLDATPVRSLMFTKWTVTNGRDAQANRLPYFIIPGSGNATNTRTGDFIELPNGDVAVVFCTNWDANGLSTGPKNVKLVIISETGTTGAPIVKSTTDLTAYSTADGVSAGTGMQLALSGQNEILVGWNVFTGNTSTKTSFRLVDYDGNITSTIEDINQPLLYHGQSMKNTSDNKIVFVSTGTGNALKVNLFAPETTLPVTFANKIEAKINTNQLTVNWSTASELNNDHFDIEVSKNGNDFKKIGEVVSKSSGGQSGEMLDYSFSTGVAGILATIPLFLLALVPAGVSRRRKILTFFAMGGLLIYGIACKKNTTIQTEVNQKVYVRVAQVDKDGSKKYAEVVTAINQ